MKFRKFSIPSIILALLALCELSHAHYSPELGNFLSRDPIEEDGGMNLYAFAERDPVNKYDELGLAFVSHPLKRVQSIVSGNTLGFHDSLCVILTKRCECDQSTNVWFSKFLAFHVHSQIYVRTHMAGRSNTDRSIAHVKRPEPAILATIDHEQIHADEAEKWHDTNEAQIKIDLSEDHVFTTAKACEIHRREMLLKWRAKWETHVARQNAHPDDLFGDDPSIGSGVPWNDYPDGYTPQENDPHGTRPFWNSKFEKMPPLDLIR